MKVKEWETPQTDGYYIMDLHNEGVQDCFRWIADNKEDFMWMIDRATEVSRDNKRLGMRYFVERLRYERHVKVPNVYVSMLARIMMCCRPQHLKGKFVTGKSRFDCLDVGGQDNIDKGNDCIVALTNIAVLQGKKDLDKAFVKLVG